jgi:hypothetical protein
MATTTRRRTISNPARRRLSPARIRAGFGGKRRQAGLKAARRRKGSGGAVRHRSRSQSNPGEILTFTLNPGQRSSGGGKKMAATKRKRRRASSGSHHHRRAVATNRARRRRSVSNPGRRRRRRRVRMNARRHGVRRNPATLGGSIKDLFTSSVFIVGGAVGSKLLTQAALGSNNTGIMGYAGNAGVTLALAWAAAAFLKNKAIAHAVAAGGMVQIVLRLIADYTPWGQYTSNLGVGDYQVSNFVTPQRYVDALHSAQIQIPAGWGAPPVVVQSAAPPAGHTAGMSGGLYTGGGLYSM